ncbi:hypothetical protein [Paraburkholderia youngii]|uniref:hypothetical protein n=1 Tax=Paraburkholderia youngii TaxID=2782701 RepID=UPI0020CF34BC|nr:hypothetical protein [Paraburkholderia youngii]
MNLAHPNERGSFNQFMASLLRDPDNPAPIGPAHHFGEALHISGAIGRCSGTRTNRCLCSTRETGEQLVPDGRTIDLLHYVFVS